MRTPVFALPSEVTVNVAALRSMPHSASEGRRSPVRYDLASGPARAYQNPLGADVRWHDGPGFIAVCEGATCRGYEVG